VTETVELKAAFRAFTAASNSLETAYELLSREVGELRATLARTQAERDAAIASARHSQLDHLLDRHQRLATLGEMAATLAHQIRTPLSAALLYATNAARPGLPPPRRDDLLARSIACLNDLERLVSDMLAFARGAGNRDAPVLIEDLGAATERAAAALLRPGQTLRIELFAGQTAVCGNREALQGAILNLVSNALEAGGSEAVVRIDMVVRGGHAELRVTDNGPGIPESLRQRIFEPFFTTRPTGTGLGLSVARSVAEAHGGQLLLEPGPVGAVFVLRLPLAAGVTALPVAAA
jgi:two-component system sensor histidine kinase FlrB